jgi:phosphoglycolate phosphatase-like HAD superfamily hydrolase
MQQALKLPAPPEVIIFDFDGVIIDSADIKLRAYTTIYADEDPAKLKELTLHATLHGGITRRDKFITYERDFFGRAADAQTIDLLCRRYSDLVYAAVIACPFIRGAIELLDVTLGKVPMHVVSGTPETELIRVVEDRKLTRYFKTVRGAPAKKPDAFAQIVRNQGCRPAAALAVGDSMTEYLAAKDLGIPFLGVAPKNAENPFPEGVFVLPSLVDACRVLAVA